MHSSWTVTDSQIICRNNYLSICHWLLLGLFLWWIWRKPMFLWSPITVILNWANIIQLKKTKTTLKNKKNKKKTTTTTTKDVIYLPVTTSNDDLEVRAEVGKSSGSGSSDPTRSSQHQNTCIPRLVWELNPVLAFLSSTGQCKPTCALQMQQSPSHNH